MFVADDTIVAVSSAAGAAGRSIVRLSGPGAIALAEGVFSEPLDQVGGFRAIAGSVAVESPHDLQAPARVYIFRAPRSYTRQDVLELHVPGEVVAAVVCAELIRRGARPAAAGEFTARAFFSGRLDLAAAEAVADIIDAEADAHLRSAVGVMDGALARLCRPAAEGLTETLALTEASIDFADDDIELAPAAQLAQRVGKVAEELTAALSSTGVWTPAAAEPKVAIAGRPNAGKSSLLNALSGLDRAIVSALAGTTRDVLSAAATLPEGLEIMLLDAAGLDVWTDPLSRAAHAAAREAVARADAVLFVIDAAATDDAETLLAEVRQLNRRGVLLVLANKIDLVTGVEQTLLALRERLDVEAFPVSAVTGAGLDELRAKLAEELIRSAPPQASGILLHDRQRSAIETAAAASARAAELLSSSAAVTDSAEIVAVELRVALDALAELTGEVIAEDVLAAIFSRFCIGK